jgi:hypothetical protein
MPSAAAHHRLADPILVCRGTPNHQLSTTVTCDRMHCFLQGVRCANVFYRILLLFSKTTQTKKREITLAFFCKKSTKKSTKKHQKKAAKKKYLLCTKRNKICKRVKNLL